MVLILSKVSWLNLSTIILLALFQRSYICIFLGMFHRSPQKMTELVCLF